MILALAALLLIGWGAFSSSGSGSGQAQAQDRGPGPGGGPPFQLLIVDETGTFASSMRVEVLARALKRTGLFALSARVVKVESSFADPLQGLEPDKRYDLIVIVPRGIDDRTVRQVWIATRPFPEISEELRSAVAMVKAIADKIFTGVAEAVDVTEDAIPGLFATIFIKEGWL
ncbi:MAG: hypothetical protein ACUVRH_02455 [Candidatus Bipolaricaulia bacterium]